MAEKRQKPNRPAGFPLYAHASGVWAKEIRGRTFYFGPWGEPDEAVKRYLQEKDYLEAGVEPPSGDGLKMFELFDMFLESRLPDINTGELTYRTWDDYRRVCKLISDKFGDMLVAKMSPVDFQAVRTFLSEGVGVGTLANRIRCARVAFRHMEVALGQTPRWGRSFGQPSARSLRLARVEAGEKIYTAEQIRAFLDASKKSQLHTMILLGISVGFGNTDCSELPWSKVDLENGWHNFERPKTLVPRRAKLWPEVIESLGKIESDRSGIVFVTKYGNAWIRDVSEGHSRIDAISAEASKIGLEFYSLRRTFRTISDETLDRMACRAIMGHASSSADMDAVYVRRIDDSRLVEVSNYVRDWLYK